MKRIAIALLLLVASVLPASAQTYYDIDVDLPTFPEMEPIADSPVYYAPNVPSNYFFYDGLYWDYYNDGWYTSTWYNGPWEYVDPIYVPTYVLWVPIRYYRRPPAYFRHWNSGRPPRWGEHWGRDWQDRHNANFGGNNARPAVRAPLPNYQRQYNRNNYPRGAQQFSLHGQNYGYRPHEGVIQQHYQSRGMWSVPGLWEPPRPQPKSQQQPQQQPQQPAPQPQQDRAQQQQQRLDRR
jgi:hypothetical protein